MLPTPAVVPSDCELLPPVDIPNGYDEEFDVTSCNLTMDNYRLFTQYRLFGSKTATQYTSADYVIASDHLTENPTESSESRLVDKLDDELFKKFQETQEERITLDTGGTQFHTSGVTLRADPNS